MNQETIRALAKLNRHFYEEVAISFSDTRQYAWPSWERFWELAPLSSGRKIADIGCGNARLARWLNGKLESFTYVGYEQNSILLQQAKAAFPQGKFVPLDIVEALFTQQEWLNDTFSCLAVFGLVHHIPSQELRLRFFRTLEQHLTDTGCIWLTAWQPRSKVLDASAIASSLKINAEQLEQGDGFLGWKDSTAIRYVHFFRPGEIESLAEQSSLRVLASWKESSLGERGNLCFLLRKK